MTLSDGHGDNKPGVRGIRITPVDEGNIRVRVTLGDEMKWAGEAIIPDYSSLTDIQALQLKSITESVDKGLREELKSFIGQPNTPETQAHIQNVAERMIREQQMQQQQAIRTPKHVLQSINPKDLIQYAINHCDYESIMSEMMKKLGRQPTMNAVHRTLEFITSTTYPAMLQEDFDPEEFVTMERDHRPLHQQQLDVLMSELSQLIFVSKARVIMNDYPESISISVQMSPAIQESEAEVAMQAFEDVLTQLKPKGLIELEVSITNKVVY